MNVPGTPGTPGTPEDREGADLRAHVDALVPRMALDLDATRSRGRRRARRRAAGVGAGSVAACAAVFGLLVLGGQWQPPANGDVALGSAASADQAPVPGPTTAPASGGTDDDVPAPVVLSPGVVAAAGGTRTDPPTSTRLGRWDGLDVALVGTPDGGVGSTVEVRRDGGLLDPDETADQGTDEVQVSMESLADSRDGVFAWGTAPRGATRVWFWSTVRPAQDRTAGPLVVEVPTFRLAPAVAGAGPTGGPTGATTDPPGADRTWWALGLFGTTIQPAGPDTARWGVAFQSSDGTLGSAQCTDLASRTCMHPVPGAVATALADATGSPASATSPSAGAIPTGAAATIRTRASELMGAMWDGSTDGAGQTVDAETRSYWHGLDGELDRLVTDAETSGWSRSAPVVELGYFTYPVALEGRTPEWVGWVDGRREIVKDVGGGTLVLDGAVPGGSRTEAFPLRETDEAGTTAWGDLTIVSHDYDDYLVGSVLGFTDAHGREHHLDLLTRSWID